MKHNNFGWFIFVVCIVLWSLYEVYPPSSRNLIQEFASRAQNPDATFSNIVTQATDLEKTGTNRLFISLLCSMGTNEMQPYFPKISATNQVHPNLYILNRLQRY